MGNKIGSAKQNMVRVLIIIGLVMVPLLAACGSKTTTTPPVTTTPPITTTPPVTTTPLVTTTPPVTTPPATTTPQADNVVLLFDRSFMPTTLTVPVGTTVTWINMDPRNEVPEGHDVTLPGLFQVFFLGLDDTFSYTFTEAGVFYYSCEIHSQFSMDGRVIVE